MVTQAPLSAATPDNYSYIQQLATDPENSVYISASAGSGKTKVLVDRVLRLLLKGTRASNILCLTFTNAAANEMLERLKQKLYAWVTQPQGTVATELKLLVGREASTTEINLARQLYGLFLDELENIKIQTIHSFCTQILSLASSISEGTNESAALINPFIKGSLIRQAFINVLELTTTNKTLAKYLQKLATLMNHQTLLEMSEKIISQSAKFRQYTEKFGGLSGLIASIQDAFSADPEANLEAILQKGIEALSVEQIALQTITELLQDSALNQTDYKTLKTFIKWHNYSPEIKRNNFSKYSSLFLTAKKEPRLRLCSQNIKKSHPRILELLAHQQEIVYDLEQKLSNQRVIENSTAFLAFTFALYRQFEALKKEHNYREYDDLLLQTIDLLQKGTDGPSILYRFDIMLDHVLVDEAQDLSALQWELIKLVTDDFFAGISAKANNRTVFIVGDFKQSIFSFQGAEPELFQQAGIFYRDKVRSAKKKWFELELNTSFRSTTNILKLVDQVFRDLEYKEALGAREHQKIQHIPFRREEGTVALWPIVPLQPKGKSKNTKGWNIPTQDNHVDNISLTLAKNIAATINEWIGNKVIKSKERRVQPADIMILLRRRGVLEQYLGAELKNCGLEVESSSIGFEENLLTQDLMSVAKFIALPEDSLNLAGLLKSPIIGITEEELFQAAYSLTPEPLWTQICKKQLTCQPFLAKLLSYARTHSLYELYFYILYKCDKITSFIARFGQSSITLVQRFLEHVLEYEQSPHSAGTEYFIYWFYETHRQANNAGSSSPTKSSVRLMTVHAAKGLQAPIVILADATHSENMPHDSIIWNSHGLLLTVNENFNHILKIFSHIKKKQQYQENLRLLYVAMTRAEEELHLYGADNKTLHQSWYKIIASSLQNNYH